ncbi:MAG: hypothetical protein A3A61_04090 [Candidatus Woykebacteria bacterium RIFCSPLOWO2_01_FULL_43_14]|uniref:Glycosyltransferase n=2 Tax=Candidatus Woykeibacteriota TaxID=1817899 RepID=A0A1G1WY45_9BACT|nr:MAG: hypothetical protein A3J50_00080 [Candidatus Woykebacteria bacterium RIFCSPHIGHO2_02_FULL_43_16b]OGY32643.1 MAG: hypothetical protein A3A61_04090 [Candidatus Woykebacteria bacterium RIFCSPLOWO2_01_FULL_43_14]
MEIDFKSPPNLTHFLLLNSDKGIIQHTLWDDPALEHGYSIDDQTRALIVVTDYLDLYKDSSKELGRDLEKLQKIYVNYIEKVQKSDSLFFNYISSEGEVLTHDTSQDSFGRVLWSLGHFLFFNKENKTEVDIKLIIDKSSKQIDQVTYIRALSYSVIGLGYLAKVFPRNTFYMDKLIEIENKILDRWLNNASSSWKWYENSLTYANSTIPLSLLYSYQITQNASSLRVALESLDFLEQNSRVRGKPSPVGNKGWYTRGETRATYDQQVIDVTDMVLTYSEAYKISRDPKYLDLAYDWFDWFGGNNLINTPMLSPETGAVYDGLGEGGVSRNKGAESIICYLMAYLSLAKVSRMP